MGALRGALLGTLAVSALDVAVRTSSGASKLGGAFTGLATALNYVISPDLPLIPAYYLPNGGGKNGSRQSAAQILEGDASKVVTGGATGNASEFSSGIWHTIADTIGFG